MQLTFVRDEQEFDRLEEAWNRLLSRAATNVPFLRHEYMLAWWSTLGGGEWEAGELWIGVARDQADQLLGAAPLFLTRTPEGRQSLLLLGTVEISDYLDLIVPEPLTVPFVEALAMALDREGPSGWEVLDLYNIPEGSPTLPALEAVAAQRGWSVSQERLQPCPVIALEGDWETYLARLDRKQRHEVRRKIRRAERHPDGASWRIIGPEEDVEQATETFMGLMAYDHEKADFLTSVMRSQLRRSVRAASERGWLQLSFLEIGGEPAAGYLNFDYEGRLWIYNSGLNPKFLSLSPGWVLLSYLIRWAIENGRSEVDFLRGEEDYKYRLGGVDRYIRRVIVTR